jgi:hypothetical protein
MDEAELSSLLQSSVDGLPKEEAAVRRARYGPNEYRLKLLSPTP